MAYSNDLREKILQAYQSGKGSIRQLAKIFHVSTNFIVRLLKLYRETGSVEKRPHGGGRKPNFDEEGMEKLRELVEEVNDATIEEYQRMLEKSHGIKASHSSVGRALLKISTRKKKRIRVVSIHQWNRKNVEKNT